MYVSINYILNVHGYVHIHACCTCVYSMCIMNEHYLIFIIFYTFMIHIYIIYTSIYKYIY
jgi:hypothetical protein